MDDRCDASWGRLFASVERSGRQSIAFVLGSGVSYSCEAGRRRMLPDWLGLVQALGERAGLPNEQIEFLRRRDRPLPAIVSLIRARMRSDTKTGKDNDRDWVSSVRQALYAEFLDACRQKNIEITTGFLESDEKDPRSKKAYPELADFLEEHFPTMAAVVDVCATETQATDDPERRFARRPRVAAVLTYNLDALVQLQDRARHGRRVLRTVERASKESDSRKIPLYHLHGYLQPLEVSRSHEAVDMLVLDEAEYNGRTDEPYSFAMTSMLWALREAQCVFVGCSMTDELMRRTLYRSREERRKAYEAERSCEEGANEKKAAEGVLRHFAVVPRQSDTCAPQLSDEEMLIEADLERLGVRPLWVADFKKELPGRIRTLGSTLDRGLSHTASRTG